MLCAQTVRLLVNHNNHHGTKHSTRIPASNTRFCLEISASYCTNCFNQGWKSWKGSVLAGPTSFSQIGVLPKPRPNRQLRRRWMPDVDASNSDQLLLPDGSFAL